MAAVDETGEEVQRRFVDFLENYEKADAEPSLYETRIEQMLDNEHSTLYVDFAQIITHDSELADAVELEFYRFEPFLRHAIGEVVAHKWPHEAQDSNGCKRDFSAAVHGMPNVERIRAMRTDRIGRLVGVSGTVTRTSDVRPELLVATFTCAKCGLVAADIEQQFRYTTPVICSNPACNNANASEFTLDLERSKFTDWQRVRVQENPDEIPAGSMPRSLDVIVRHDVVERAKAGDKVVFTGMLVVLPDNSNLARAGESTLATKGGRGGAGTDSGPGVSGLKNLGVREMTYRLAFVASSVQPQEQRTSGCSIRTDESGGVDSVDGTSGPERMSEEEMHEIQGMRATPQLYHKLVKSVAPGVFGHIEVKRGVLLMLFGGVHKKTSDQIKLRGDINVCIVGDPSTAKSQFLKCVPRRRGRARARARLTSEL